MSEFWLASTLRLALTEALFLFVWWPFPEVKYFWCAMLIYCELLCRLLATVPTCCSRRERLLRFAFLPTLWLFLCVPCACGYPPLKRAIE